MVEVNPRLVYCAFSPFGQKGKLKDYVGNELIAQAMSGVIATTGFPDRLPHKAGPPFATHTSAVMGGISVLAALNFREDSGLGQEIDMAVFDAMVSYLYTFIPGHFVSGKAPNRLGNRHPMAAPWNAYEAKDGWVVICIGDDRGWKRFVELIGQGNMIDNPKYESNNKRIKEETRVEVEKIVADWVSNKSIAEIMEILEKIGVPAGPIYTIEQLLRDEQFLSREMLQELVHPVSGSYYTFGSVFKMSITPGRVSNASPLHGQHGRSLLKGICGYEENYISALQDKGIMIVKD
jgi:crotonobetainyl-CoA:carnitine CoA-transferase CaiB-like acyl-CoA transferase